MHPGVASCFQRVKVTTTTPGLPIGVCGYVWEKQHRHGYTRMDLRGMDPALGVAKERGEKSRDGERKRHDV